MMQPNEKQSVLVCGGAGYIGSHVVRELISDGHDVVVFDNLSTGRAESVPAGTELIVGSIGDYGLLASVFRKHEVDLVVHLCADAYVGESVNDPLKYYDNNVSNGVTLIRAMLDNGVSKMVFSSSCAVYGEPEQLPITEENSFAPVSPYGRTKAMLEQVLEDTSRASGLKYCALRYFNASGADASAEIGEDHSPETHLIPLVLQNAKTDSSDTGSGHESSLKIFGDNYETPDGTCVRDYVHVSDIAIAHRLAITYLVNGGDSTSVNLSNERGFSVKEIIQVASEVTGHQIPFEIAARRPGDPAELVGSAAKAKTVLGWEPIHSDLRNVLSTAWKWHTGVGFTHPVENKLTSVVETDDRPTVSSAAEYPADFWDRLYQETGEAVQSAVIPQLHARLREIIPDDVSTILDAGCGGGSLMAFLSQNSQLRISGVDRSPEGVKSVVDNLGLEAIQGDIRDLDFADDSYDAVVCSEVLEHLPFPDIEQALSELMRVARKYVILTNPYSENLRYHQLECGRCRTNYHPAGHIHSVDENFINDLAASQQAEIKFYYTGSKPWHSNRFSNMLRSSGNRVLGYNSFCPVCGYETPSTKWDLFTRAVGHSYTLAQKVLAKGGVRRPAGIVSLIELR